MTARMTSVILLAVGVGAGSASGGGPAIAMGEALEFPRAGICLSVPKGFAAQPLGEPYDVMRSVLRVKGKAVQAVSLSAFAVGAKETRGTFAEKMLAEARKSLAVRGLKVRKKTPMAVGGVAATAHLLTYTFRGVETTAARVFFIRDVKNTSARICYVLTVESAPARKDKLLPVLGEVVKTVKLIDVAHPVALGIRLLGEEMTDHKRGCAIRPPRSWYATRTSVGIQMAVTDYLMGGAPAVTATVAVADVAAAATPQACARQAIDRATKAAAVQNRFAEVVSRSAEKLGGLDGYQFVLRQVPKKPGNGDLPVFIVHRVVCGPAGAKKRASYSLIVVCQGGQAKAAAAMMAKLARGFRFVEPPTTKPATRPTPPAKGKSAGAKPDKGT